MKTNFFSFVPRALRTLLACGALTGWLAAATADGNKSPEKSSADIDPAKSSAEKKSIDPAKVAAKSPWPELRNLMYRGDFAFDEQEALEIDAIYAAAKTALLAIQPGATAGVQQRAVKLKWAADMETFLNTHTNSGWAPGIALLIANVSRERLGYSKAADMYARAWDSTKASSDGRTLQIAEQAGRELAGILAMTGQLGLFDDLIAESKLALSDKAVSEWWWPRELAGWARRYPDEAYKCGLACLDQLGRLTEPGSGRTATIFYRASGLKGYTAAELVQIAGDVGLHVRAVRLQDLSVLPIPSIVHLGIGHFVVVRQKHQGFYEIMDPVQSPRRWLTAAEIAQEATGCLIVSAYSDLSGVASLTSLTLAEAAAFQGRCYHGNAIDRNDGCPEESSSGGSCPTCPNAGVGGPGGGSPRHGGSGGGGSGGGSCTRCIRAQESGAPTFKVSQPYLNVWLSDTPISFSPAYGPEVRLTLQFHTRQDLH